MNAADRPRIQEAVRGDRHQYLRGLRLPTARSPSSKASPPLVNDPALAAASWPWARRGGFAIDDNFRSCGADDFSYYLTTAPTLMLFVGTHDDITLHNPRFLPPDESVGEVASAMLAGYLAALTRLPAPRPGHGAAARLLTGTTRQSLTHSRSPARRDSGHHEVRAAHHVRWSGAQSTGVAAGAGTTLGSLAGSRPLSRDAAPLALWCC